jgi:hypothetical protein
VKSSFGIARKMCNVFPSARFVGVVIADGSNEAKEASHDSVFALTTYFVAGHQARLLSIQRMLEDLLSLVDRDKTYGQR